MSGSSARVLAGDVPVERVAVLGAGLIGRSWAALFAAAGLSLSVYDPDPNAHKAVEDAIASAWPTLRSLGLATTPEPHADIAFFDDPAKAIVGAQFVQESVPERIATKTALYEAIEPYLEPGAVVATSASGLTLSEMQAGWLDPSRFVLGHPFNPPHLIPLVEVMGNARTAPGVVAEARAFYESVGKVTIEVLREVPGHVANRLQAALWREAIHLVNEGVATVGDVDIAVASGPGARWAVMGPTTLFHLGGDAGGLATFCERYTDSFNRWWDDLGDPRLDEATAARLVAGLADAVDGQPMDDLVALRDERLAKVIATTHPRDGGDVGSPA